MEVDWFDGYAITRVSREPEVWPTRIKMDVSVERPLVIIWHLNTSLPLKISKLIFPQVIPVESFTVLLV